MTALRGVEALLNSRWRRWLREWLQLLNASQKWNKTQADLKVVLAISPESPRAHWPLARVLEVSPGQDGHVRVVKLQEGKDTVVRPKRVTSCQGGGELTKGTNN